jgi:ABC-type transport system involved in multi-copper enzyme maturation permease subunit
LLILAVCKLKTTISFLNVSCNLSAILALAVYEIGGRMKTIIRYTLITARRDWLVIGLLTIVAMAYGLSVFTGGTAIVEQMQMSMAYFAGSSRIALQVGLIVFVCFHVRRLFDNREIESMLSKPISRSVFVISYWLGFVILAFVAVVPVIMLMSIAFVPNLAGLTYWAFSLLLEIAIVLAFALVSSLILSSAVSAVMASFAFYLISRLMGFFVATLDQPSLLTAGKYGQIMGKILQALSSLIPRLDLYAKSSWLIYGTEGQKDLWVFQAQSFVFIGVLLAMAVFDFKRKEF